VQKAIKTKRITPNADGPSIRGANQEWEGNTFRARRCTSDQTQVVPLSAPPTQRVAVRVCQVNPTYRAILSLHICGHAL